MIDALLNEDNVWVENDEELKNLAYNYYYNLF